MMRIIKYLCILFVVVVAAVFAAFHLVPQAKWRALIADEISRKLGREVKIGQLHLGLAGITIDQLSLSEVPTFRAGTLFDADGVRLGWNLSSLWKGFDVRKKMLTQSAGSFHIKDFRNPHYQAKDFSLKWSLSNITPTGNTLNGWARLEQSAGAMKNIDALIAKSASTKVALAPIVALINLEKSGLLRIGLPNLQQWPIDGVLGRYDFKNGLMTIKQFDIKSPELGMGTTGTVELGSGQLALNAKLHSPDTARSGGLDADLKITGTTSQPKVDLTSLKKKAFQASVKKLLNSNKASKDAGETLKNLFK